MLVTTERQLASICGALRAAGSFALDTEFVQERTFYARLGIIQVAAPGTEAVIDPLEIESLDALYELIHDPGIEKVVHAGKKDFEILYERTGRPPQNVFDAQIAAAFVGYGYQLSLANLVQKSIRKRLDKLETLTDWTRRPLTDKQIEYALDDVRYLPQVREHIGDKLRELGRESWANEECRTFERAEAYVQAGPREAYLRLKGRGTNPRTLGILRELAAWREEEAINRDVPRSSLIRDEVLVEIARRAPKTLAALRDIRLLRGGIGEKRGQQILDAVALGAANPVRETFDAPPTESLPSDAGPLVRLTEAWLRTRAAEAHVASEMLATRSDLDDLAAAFLAGGEEANVPVLKGWRRELVGEDLIAILAGKLRLAVDPRNRKVVADRIKS